MAEREALQKRYAYQEMSNKVEQADRSMLERRSTEEDGVSSLWGRKDAGRMGDRVLGLDAKAKKELLDRIGNSQQKKKKRKIEDEGIGANKERHGILSETGGQTILDMERLGYRPSHAKSRLAYESILNNLSSNEMLGSQSPSVLKDAAEELINILKNENLRDPERQNQISVLLLGKSDCLSNSKFTNFVSLGKQIDDFDQNANGTDDKVASLSTTAMEEGVAVIFDSDEENGGDEEEDKDNDGKIDEVVEVALSSDDESEDEMEGTENFEMQNAIDNDETVLGASRSSKDKFGNNMHGMTENSDTLSVHDIDAHWLQRELSKCSKKSNGRGGDPKKSQGDEIVTEDQDPMDANDTAKLSNQILDVLEKVSDLRECENKLLVLLGFDMFGFIKTLLRNRVRLWACIKMKRLGPEKEAELKELKKILLEEKTGEGKNVWEELNFQGKAKDWTRERMQGVKERSQMEANRLANENMIVKEEETNQIGNKVQEKATELDLNLLSFKKLAHVMTSKNCELPEKSWRAMKKGYEEIHVPAVKANIPKDEKLVKISDMPAWTQKAFSGMEKLNRIQSKMYETALFSSENLVLCAPTGAGKTNVAVLSILNIIAQYRNVPTSLSVGEDKEAQSSIDLAAFKIVYIAPMKALVHEIVKNFSNRLSYFNINVRELSGDSSLTRQQIADTQVIVTTPEKWDVVSRQGEGRAYTQLVKLVIVDEIHLLADDRGAVLEAILARVIRQVESSHEPIRLVGLSATLPNYKDVATLLRVKPDKGLYFFDHSYRPVPLHMQYIGITEKNAFKRFQLQNDICYEKIRLQRNRASPNQALIFVHSRSECGKTAKALKEMALDREENGLFVRDGGATQEILRDELVDVKNEDLRDVLPFGFAIHHAGMCRSDRELVEDLFADGHIAVICCTATLAWGVNLPAHAVILRGTQIYNPKKGHWTELSPLDVLQMLGRAGRPGWDSEGEGIILTQHSELQYYLSLTNLQLPIESQLVSQLADHLNAEIVLGTVETIKEAMEWICYTFLYIRMLQNPELYGIFDPVNTIKNDPTLKQRRLDLVHTAALCLERSNLVRYCQKTGTLQTLMLGKISSQYYIKPESIAIYNRHLRPNISDIELLRLFSLSGEFSHITVREEEKLELNKLSSKVPIPVKESPNEPLAKINILLQAYISRLKLDGFALVADMAFIQQSAARVMRALFEISLKRNWASLSKLTLAFANMVSQRIWRSQSPLRQFQNVPEIVSRKLERKTDIEWSRYSDLTSSDLGELVGVPKMGRTLHTLIHRFPKLELAAHVQPITRSMVRVELTITPDFEYDMDVHGSSLNFFLLVEDNNNENILHHEVFNLKSSQSEEESNIIFTIPMLEPMPPSYFIRVVSDRWLHSESVLPISFQNMILPSKYPPPTELLDLAPLPIAALGEEIFMNLYTHIDEFNPIQTQTYSELFKTEHNVLVCAPEGSGKTVCAEFAILHMMVSNGNGKCVYVTPKEEIAAMRAEDWKRRFGCIFGIDKVAKLGGETTSDLRSLAESKIIVCTVRQWDALSRRWRQRKAVQAVSLFIVDDLHFVGGSDGPTMEIIISRMQYMRSQRINQPDSLLRIVCLSAPLANAREVGEWIGVSSSKSLFNFSPKVRPIPLDIFFRSFDQHNFSSRLLAMAKPMYTEIMRHSLHFKTENKSTIHKPVLIFVPSRRQAQITAIDLMTHRENFGSSSFLGDAAKDMDMSLISSKLNDTTLQQTVTSGIGILHEGLQGNDSETVSKLYQSSVLSVLICPASMCWKINHSSHLVIIMGTEFYDGREKSHVDYPIADILNMMGKAIRAKIDSRGKCVIFCHTPKKEHLKKFIFDPLPVESHLDHYLHDHMNAEIVSKTIVNMQDAVDYITWTFLYRRLTKNPNYYSMQGTSNIHLSEHMSEMVESVLSDLDESKCCQVSDEGNVTPLNLGMIAAYYYIQYTTIELIASSVNAKTKTKGVLEILSASSEFSYLPIRQGEDRSLRKLAKDITHKLPSTSKFNDPNTKALILLQCHFSRTPLVNDLLLDQHGILKESICLIQAIVDVISSNGWLKPALAAMEVSQMIVQGMWNKDNVLMQIPHFSKEIIERCNKYEGEEPIESVFDILTLEDNDREMLLQLSPEKMGDVAIFCNNYPNVDMTYEVIDQTNIVEGDTVRLKVKLERDFEDDIQDDVPQFGVVTAPFFPKEKMEAWWIVVGNTDTNTLMSIKRVNLNRSLDIMLEFMAPEEPGDHNLKLFCMSDSYLGCDQEYTFLINVKEGESDEEEDDEMSDSDDNK